MNATTLTADRSLAVLVSGGVDSAVLVGESIRDRVVHPLYVRFGLTWEEAELLHLRRFLAAIACANLKPLTILDLPVRDLYGSHWSITGQDVPALGTPDEDVFLPGRNVLFLSKAVLWCHLHQVPAVALAPLSCNPFPDGTPHFFASFAALVNEAVGGAVKVLLPYRELSKVDVLHRAEGMPLEWTFSCIRPIHNQHCGTCSKCGERQQGFRDAKLSDPTPYHAGGPSCSA